MAAWRHRNIKAENEMKYQAKYRNIEIIMAGSVMMKRNQSQCVNLTVVV